MSIIEHAAYYEEPIYNVSHVHTSCEIMHIVSGTVHLTAGEQSVILTDGDSALIKSRQHHDVRIEHDTEYKRFITVINPWELKKQLVRPDLFTMLTDISKDGLITVKNRPELRNVFEKMEDIFKSGGNIYSELSAALEAVSAFYDVVRPREENAVKRSAAIFAENVRTYIEQHYADNIKIADVAKEYFTSESYLSHAFKRETGISPKSYLTHIRCTRAYELIKHTTMTFSDIAANTGFCSQSDMCKKIRKYYGLTATEIRYKTDSK